MNMNTITLIELIRSIRLSDPSGFIRKTIRCGSRYEPVLYRQSRVTVFNKVSAGGEVALLTYSDQNPNGYSKEAELVRTGKLKPQDIGWLFLYYPHSNIKLWLAKIVKEKVTVYQNCAYNKDQRRVSLI